MTNIYKCQFSKEHIRNNYNDMMKAKRNADYLATLDKSMAEAEAGRFITKTITELKSYTDC